MAKKISVTSIALILLWMVCITTQKKTVKCKSLVKKYDKIVKKLKKASCEGNQNEYVCSKLHQHNLVPFDGVWEEWTETSTCSVTCGGGTKTYIRNCVKPQHGGKACEGDASKTDTCGEEECPSTFKECDNPVAVKNYVKIPWNPDSQSITITSDVRWGHNQGLSVWFFDKNDQYTGNVQVRNQSQTNMSYWIEWCYAGVNAVWKPLPVTIPTETRKTWTFTYNYAEQRVVYHYNGVEVLNVVLSSTCGNTIWRTFWEKKPTQIWFANAASRYCFSSN